MKNRECEGNEGTRKERNAPGGGLEEKNELDDMRRQKER